MIVGDDVRFEHELSCGCRYVSSLKLAETYCGRHKQMSEAVRAWWYQIPKPGRKKMLTEIPLM